MQKITNFFIPKKCLSGNLENYGDGEIPFVSNTNLNNGITRYVDVIEEKEIIDDLPCLAINGFGFATIQQNKFIGSGNGGVYVSALIPERKMPLLELAYYCSQINLQSWRFSYGRRAIKHRILQIKLQKYTEQEINTNLVEETKSIIFSKINNLVENSF